MAGKNEMELEIMPDGELKITTGDFAGTNHKSADEFLKYLETALGGKMTKAKAPHAHGHHHSHNKQQQ